MSREELHKFPITRNDLIKDSKLLYLDKKHKGILQEAAKTFDQQGLEGLAKRSWKMQNDIETPSQFNLKSYNFYGLKYWFYKQIKFNIFRRADKRHLINSLLDDLHIVKLSNGLGLLKKNPCHLQPGGADAFFYHGLSLNPRWLRYIYFATSIKNNKILKDHAVWMDLGSYYGGLAGILLQEYKNVSVILVDFGHQLLKSYYYLQKKFPAFEHILPDECKKIKNFKTENKTTIFYLNAKDFNPELNYKLDLFTNTFSLGEMHREIFQKYTNSCAFKQSKFNYLVNRFISSPWFEKTYGNNITVKDYFNCKKEVVKMDIFPIHYTLLLKNNLFGRQSSRPMSSSPYFELILKK